jgi:hypothetical protein
LKAVAMGVVAAIVLFLSNRPNDQAINFGTALKPTGEHNQEAFKKKK